MVKYVDGGLRKLFKDNIPGHWSCIESAWSAKGVPDAEYCLPPGATGWIEFKRATGGAIVVRPLQSAWASARIAAGGVSLVAVRLGDVLTMTSGSALRTMLLEAERRRGRPATAAETRRGVRCRVADAQAGGHDTRSWAGGPSRWRWGEIEEVLRLGLN